MMPPTAKNLVATRRAAILKAVDPISFNPNGRPKNCNLLSREFGSKPRDSNRRNHKNHNSLRRFDEFGLTPKLPSEESFTI
jgi:hypothetical protein